MILRRLSSFSLGLLAGAMLLIAVAVVPFWKELPPALFRVWFAKTAPLIRALMVPLGGVGALLTLAALVSGWQEWGARRALALAAAATLAVVAITLLVNEPANALFARPGALTDPETVALLDRWARWHWVRAAFGVVAFASSLRALDLRRVD
jgi:hypothetical protein